MPVSRDTLHRVRDLRITVGTEADAAVASLTRAWARAWHELARSFRTALVDVAALAADLERWPAPGELIRIERLRAALDLAERRLTELAQQTGVTVTDAAGNAMTATAEAEPHILASQLPPAERAAAAVRFDRLTVTALDAIVRRTQRQITSTALPLSRSAHEAIRRELIRGIALGTGPRDVARQMLARTEGAFNGGLTRALNISRTEILDAYRVVSRASHLANADVAAGWRWHSAMDRRTCPSCWAMHGTVHPADELGPNDHQQGRCARVIILRPWSELGITAKEPPDMFPDARARFARLSERDQVAIMGATRLDLLKSGRITWDDIPQLKTNPGWRPSYTPRPVGALQRLAGQSS